MPRARDARTIQTRGHTNSPLTQGERTIDDAVPSLGIDPTPKARAEDNLARFSYPTHAFDVLPSGDGKTRGVGLSGAVASLVVVVLRVTRRVTGRRVRAFRMIR